MGVNFASGRNGNSQAYKRALWTMKQASSPRLGTVLQSAQHTGEERQSSELPIYLTRCSRLDQDVRYANALPARFTSL